MPQFPNLDLPRLLHATFDSKPRRPKTTVVLLHGIGGSGEVWKLVAEAAPAHVRVITLDLLGFGESSKPKNASYNVRIQARSVAATLLTLRIRTRVIVVGHSMGSLIAIELAKRYPFLVQGLVLCSPPIYRTEEERIGTLMAPEPRLIQAYRHASEIIVDNPERAIALARAANRAGIMPPTFQINQQTLKPYVKALQAAVIDQSSYRDLANLKQPTHIIYGAFDPFVIPSNLKRLAKRRETIHLKKIIAMHEIRAPYTKAIAETLRQILPELPVQTTSQAETKNTDN